MSFGYSVTRTSPAVNAGRSFPDIRRYATVQHLSRYGSRITVNRVSHRGQLGLQTRKWQSASNNVFAVQRVSGLTTQVVPHHT